MTIAFIIALVAALVLGTAYYFQLKDSRRQADEQQQLLADYQRRVDEQQKLLEDYRALEKNFDNVGEGYEQALLAFDKMEEEQQRAKAKQEALQKRVDALQEANNKLTAAAQHQADTLGSVLSQMQQAVEASGDQKMAALVGQLFDMGDLDSDAPIERTDNIMVAQVATDAAKASGIDQAQYITFQTQVAPDAAATMLSTNQQKAVRALTHLLDNALKFTSDGSVTLLVNVNMDLMQAIYTVEDTGTGIPASEADHIFEPYVKLNSYFGGQGVGLTVARNIARRMGGDVVLDTAFAGPGARFVLSLPL